MSCTQYNATSIISDTGRYLSNRSVNAKTQLFLTTGNVTYVNQFHLYLTRTSTTILQPLHVNLY